VANAAGGTNGRASGSVALAVGDRGGIPGIVWAGWAVANAVGGLLVGVPDRGPRLFSLSRTHGPSLVDAVGALVLLFGWVALDAAVLRRRGRLREARRWLRAARVAGLIAGAGILVPAIALDLGTWWVLGAALLAAVQISAAVELGRSSGRA